MWLLDASSLKLKEFIGSTVPEYAILSHAWSTGEISHHEMQNLNEDVMRKPGFAKVQRSCQMATQYSIEHVWVDTCCIDKLSTAELTEAINSMYKWYQKASLCMIYLEDVPCADEQSLNPTVAQIEAFTRSRWFTRRWTLQELIANDNRRFFACDWSLIAVEQDRLVDVCSSVTRIDKTVLCDKTTLKRFCIAERMSWASNRTTTRPEDIAYSLMGIFNVNMPILYGEGHSLAFRRLQTEILKQSFDQTLFAWRGTGNSSGLLARSPADFADTPRLGLWGPAMLAPSSMTNTGILIRACLYKPYPTELKPAESELEQAALQCDIMNPDGWAILLIYLKPVQNTFCWINDNRCQAYRRVHCTTWKTIPCDWLVGDRSSYEELLVLEDDHLDLVRTSILQDHQRWARDQRQDHEIRLMPCDGINPL